jgi:ABC-2 type transport system permease protein
LALGCLVLPLLGAEALSLDVSLGALALISTSVSIAALGFAALIAAGARSIEQATVISGTMNILFAALGGIMIPRFIMPPLMQKLSLISPMAWAQEGFLTVLIRGGSYGAVAANSVVLIAMGCVLGALAIFVSRRRKNHD